MWLPDGVSSRHANGKYASVIYLDKSVRSASPTEMRPQWMLQLADAVGGWLKMLPKSVEKLRRTQKNIKDPLYRFFEREARID